jgi:hypothetical protein
VKRGHGDGEELFNQLLILCNLLVKYKMNECAMITFLENYTTATQGSTSTLFNIDNVDNR